MSKTVLVADDDAGFVSMMESALTQWGYGVVTAHDGKEALEKARSLPLDLILLDVSMPKMDGDELYMLLKEKDAPTKNIPILFVTGLRTEKELEQTHEDNMLAKPVHMDKLLGKMHQLMGEQP